MSTFYTALGAAGNFNEKVKDIEDEIEQKYSEIFSAVEVSKQNLLQKLRKIAELEDASKQLKHPGEALKLGFDKSVLEHIHACVNIHLSKEFRKSASFDPDEIPEAVFPRSGKDSLDISLEMKSSCSSLPTDSLSPYSTQSLTPILPTSYKKNSYPTIIAVSQGKADENLEKALGLAVHPTTMDIYIADGGNGAIKVYNKDGEFKFKFGSDGCNPYGITLYEDLVYITNWGISNFQVYNWEGAVVKMEEINILNKPRGITVDSEGNAYVCSTGNNIIVFITKDKHESKVFAAKHVFREPRDVKIHNGRIVVLDDDNPSLHFFTPQEVHQQSIVATFKQIVNPFAHAYIYDPAFFDMKSDGTILVTDRQRHYIKVYSPEGKYVTRIGKECEVTAGCFRDPEGIAIGADGRLYSVCNRRSKMLQIFC
ncbi:PEP-CTERM domain protein [Oopsacas minuta]|uniref:PEP-CTERM domain protein n=1 Tax=Oopsacas minuta TaxID=111878 RepID=A0AAV7JMS7_9METZ|nr:PEP-CTERM domain protein [Oopsacas minuta]